MNWVAFAIASWLFLGAELGLRDALELGVTGVAPSLVIVLVVFIAMSTPTTTALWAALILGVLLDLTHPVPIDGAPDAATILGPYALGLMAGAYLVVLKRAMMIRSNPFTIPVLAFMAALLMHVIVVVFFTIRAYYDPIAFAPGRELWTRFLCAVVTALGAIVLGPLLRLSAPLFAFPVGSGARRRF